ncbi:MAG: SAM-dependent methyltransferase [Candidatus Paceibacterales bacterium]
MYRKNKKDEFFTRKAKIEGYPSRSIYKLQEIDEKYHLIKKGDRVLDLGCAPGSWLLYISKKIGDKGRAVGIDIGDIKIPKKENIVFIKKDVMDLEDSDLKKINGQYQAVVSDLSPATSGIKEVDVGKSLELGEKSFEIAQKTLGPGGNFLCKIFEGESTDEFFKKVKKRFRFTKRFRPKAVRKRSKEIYIIAKDFKGP